ncbi:NADH-quinone oxidoreductase subunit N [Candidatus Marsarchaeota archaeon]|nr:NADH-quinone oxidoreductase subunit N [Candidatus Marsarchaeota archaeon]MCL5404777.1 NADH-quinone oxidoreductase subunit N [Candidatus Marsarchaeota archaeon]
MVFDATYYSIPALMFALVLFGLLSLFHRNKRVAFAATSILLAGIFAASLSNMAYGSNALLFSAYSISPFSSYLLVLFSSIFLIINWFAYSSASDYFKLNFIMSVLAIGIFTVPMANSLITIIIAIELMSAPTILLIAFGGKRYAEPATKMFLLSAISVSVLAFAIALAFPYDVTLSLHAASTANPFNSGYLLMLSLGLFVVAFGTEAALFPFNFWIPDVYQGAPSHITAMIAGLNKKVAFIALIEVLFTLFAAYTGTISVILSVVAILTMFFGNLGAMTQTSVKRMFAYSSISQAGYISVGIAAANSFGIEASLFQIFAHSFMIVGAFIIIGLLEAYGLATVKDYSGLSRRNGLAAAGLTIIMLSLAGIPPLIGFVGKFLLFSSAISSGLIALAIIGILNSFISIYYYGRLISSMYGASDQRSIALTKSAYFVIGAILAVIIAFGVYPEPLIIAAKAAATSLAGFA